MAAFLTHLRNVGHMTGDKLTELWTNFGFLKDLFSLDTTI